MVRSLVWPKLTFMQTKGGLVERYMSLGVGSFNDVSIWAKNRCDS